VLQHVVRIFAGCCSVLQHVVNIFAGCCSVLQHVVCVPLEHVCANMAICAARFVCTWVVSQVETSHGA